MDARSRLRLATRSGCGTRSQYAAKLLKQATDQFVILVEKKLGESVTSGEPVTTHELSTSLGEEKCINDK